jgi:hypothetical protein
VNGIRKWVTVSICTTLLACVGGAACARAYWTYYDCAPGLSTVVVLTNASEFAMEDAATLRLYDANGTLIVESVHDLAAYESTAVLLNGLFAETDDATWGLAEIDSRLLLQIGVWVGTEDEWLFVENYGELGANPSGLPVVAYWYGLNYANTQSRRTTVTIVNPHDRLVLGTFSMYDAYGVLQHHRNLTLPARQPTYIDLEDVFPIGDDVWGLVDIEAEEAVLVVCGYFDSEGYLIDVDVVDRPYYLEIAEQE